MKLNRNKVGLMALALGGLLIAIYVVIGTKPSAALSSLGNGIASVSDSVGLAYDPANQSLIKADQNGLVRLQANSGWEKVNAPQGLSAVVINPDDPATIYVSGRGLGVVRSNDGGQNWQAINTGLPTHDVTALALHSFRRNTLFVWVSGDGIYRTEDAGNNWIKVPDRGPPDHDVRGLVFSTLPGSMNTGWLYASTPTGAYLSMDCFCGWRSAGSVSTSPMIRSIAVDPVTPQNVYSAGPDGIFRSQDGGLTWAAVAKNVISSEPAAVAIDPGSPSSIFAVLMDGSVLHSSDSANTWSVQWQPPKAAS